MTTQKRILRLQGYDWLQHTTRKRLSSARGSFSLYLHTATIDSAEVPDELTESIHCQRHADLSIITRAIFGVLGYWLCIPQQYKLRSSRRNQTYLHFIQALKFRRNMKQKHKRTPKIQKYNITLSSDAHLKAHRSSNFLGFRDVPRRKVGDANVAHFP